MHDDFIENVYLTLQGVIAEKFRVKDVENAFEDGSACASYYAQMQEAYARLCTRLGSAQEDGDVEQIIHSLMCITDILAYKMYEYGVRFGEGKVE